MSPWKPFKISVIIAILLQVGIIPWAMIMGTLQVAPLYLIYTIPAAAIVLIIGLVMSILRKKAQEVE